MPDGAIGTGAGSEACVRRATHGNIATRASGAMAISVPLGGDDGVTFWATPEAGKNPATATTTKHTTRMSPPP